MSAIKGNWSCALNYIFIRRISIVGLLCLFLWQSYIAFAKYLSASTTFTHQILDVTTTDFPSVSVCPFDRVYDKQLHEEANKRNWTFAEHVQEAKPNFKIYYVHMGNRGLVTWDDMPPNWTQTYTTLPNVPIIIGCYKYTYEGKVAPGFAAQLSLAILSPTLDRNQIYVHNREDSVLVANGLHGKDMFITPRVETTDLIVYNTKEILSTKHNFLPKSNLPCYENSGIEFKECLERYIEREQKCQMPWNAIKNSSISSICQDANKFFDVMSLYLRSSEKILYEKTGCYTSCTIKSFATNTLILDQAPRDSIADVEAGPDEKTFLVYLYLSEGSLRYREEVLVFDFNDLIGNVGGYLGLLLGSSVLSIMDWSHEATKFLKTRHE